MPLDPSIIANSMSNMAANMPDVNALMQQRVQGMENIYKIETARQEQAKRAQQEQQAAIAQMMLPSVAAAFSDPSDAGLAAAASLLPPEVADTFAPFMDRLRGVPDPKLRQALLRAELLKDDEGKLILAQLEPTANMRLQADTAAARAALDARRLTLEEQKAAAEAARGETPSYKEVVLEDGTLVLMDQKSGRIIQPSMDGPIDTAVPPQEGAPKPLKVKQKDGATTESERLAGYNAGRALDAAKRISSALEKDPAASAPGLVETAVGRVADPNILRGEGRQRVAAAQRELIDALLTLATGAAYNREQLEGQMESYIPKWSDQPGTREDKRAALLGLIQNAKVKAGRAWTPEMDAAFQQLLTPPDVPGETQATSESEDPELNDLLEKYLPK
jgi:hypothetical protein